MSIDQIPSSFPGIMDSHCYMLCVNLNIVSAASTLADHVGSTSSTTEVCLPEHQQFSIPADFPDAIQAYLKSLNGQGTVPHVYLGGNFVGGCSELQALSKDQIQKKIAA